MPNELKQIVGLLDRMNNQLAHVNHMLDEQNKYWKIWKADRDECKRDRKERKERSDDIMKILTQSFLPLIQGRAGGGPPKRRR